jgi:hypothetical protein
MIYQTNELFATHLDDESPFVGDALERNRVCLHCARHRTAVQPPRYWDVRRQLRFPHLVHADGLLLSDGSELGIRYKDSRASDRLNPWNRVMTHGPR